MHKVDGEVAAGTFRQSCEKMFLSHFSHHIVLTPVLFEGRQPCS